MQVRGHRMWASPFGACVGVLVAGLSGLLFDGGALADETPAQRRVTQAEAGVRAAEEALRAAEKERDDLIKGFEEATAQRERQIQDRMKRANTLFEIYDINRKLRNKEEYVSRTWPETAFAEARQKIEKEKQEKEEARAREFAADKKRWIFNLGREPTRQELQKWTQEWPERWENNVSRGGRHNRDIRDAEASLARLQRDRDAYRTEKIQPLLDDRDRWRRELDPQLTGDQAANVQGAEINRLRAEARALMGQRPDGQVPPGLAEANMKVATAEANLEAAREALAFARELAEYEQRIKGYDVERLENEVKRVQDEFDSADAALVAERNAENRRLVDEMGSLRAATAESEDEADSVAAHNLAVTARRDEIANLIIRLKQGLPITRQLQILDNERKKYREQLKSALENLVARLVDELANLRREQQGLEQRLKTEAEAVAREARVVRADNDAIREAWEALPGEAHPAVAEVLDCVTALIPLPGAGANLATPATSALTAALRTDFKGNLSRVYHFLDRLDRPGSTIQWRDQLRAEAAWDTLMRFKGQCRDLDGAVGRYEAVVARKEVLPGLIGTLEAKLREYRPRLERLKG